MIRQRGALDHHLTQALDGVRHRHQVGDGLQDRGQRGDREEDPAEQGLRHDDDRDELDDLQLGPGIGRQEYPQVHRAQRGQERDAIDERRAAGGRHAQSDGERRQWPDRRDRDLREEPDEEQGDLDHGQHAEPQAIAGHDLAPRPAGEQSPEGAADPPRGLTPVSTKTKKYEKKHERRARVEDIRPASQTT
jgi:hypothetical protein